MTQKERLIELFRLNGFRLTLGQLLAHPSGVGYKAVTRFHDLRKMGYKIDLVHQDHNHPTNNVYEMTAMPNKDGQMEMV